MKSITVLNGKISLVLTPENAMEEEIIKQLNGGEAKLIAGSINILGQSVTGGLLISSDVTIEESKSKTTLTPA
jgi:hypothetical protein